jgi:hypothetical protein
MQEDFALNFGEKITGWCITTTHHITLSFSLHNSFYQKQNDCRSPTTLIFSVSQIEDETERPPFWHKWDDRGRIAGGAEHSRNTTSRMHLRRAEELGRARSPRKGTTSKVTVVSRLKVSFYQMAAQVPKIIYGWSSADSNDTCTEVIWIWKTVAHFTTLRGEMGWF